MNYLSILSLIAIAGGAYFFFTGFQLLARKRLLLATPTCKIRSAALGLVEVNGRATGPHTVEAPISGKACFLYRATAWQQAEGKKNEWQKVAEENLHLPFYVEDSTGKLLIEPLGADLDLHRDFREEYATSLFSGFEEIPPRVRAFLSRHSVGSSRALRVEEYSIKPDDALFVAGTVTENPGVVVRRIAQRNDSVVRPSLSNGTNGGEERPAPEIVRLYGGASSSSAQGMSQQAKITAALTRAGITKPEAWSAAGVPYQKLVDEDVGSAILIKQDTKQSGGNPTLEERPEEGDSVDRSTFDLNPPVVMMRGTNEPTFVISFRSQKEFCIALGWRSMGMTWGGAAITLLGVYILLEQMGRL
jgi:hypothetical protein